MNEVLLDAFRHHAWATKELLSICRELPQEHLSSATSGTFGSMIATLNHLVLADAGYLPGLTGSAPAWADGGETDDLRMLAARVDETLARWEAFLSAPLDAERWVVLDRGTYEARASVIVAQVLHHGSVHREQVCAILTASGIEPPDIQPWAYGDATGRGRARDTR